VFAADGDAHLYPFNLITRNVSVNINNSSIEILESGTYLICFSCSIADPTIAGDYTKIVYSIMSTSSPFTLGRVDGYPILNDFLHCEITRIRYLEAGQSIFINVQITGSGNVSFGGNQTGTDTKFSLVKIA
jgi:hypothetical protein